MRSLLIAIHLLSDNTRARATEDSAASRRGASVEPAEDHREETRKRSDCRTRAVAERT